MNMNSHNGKIYKVYKIQTPFKYLNRTQHITANHCSRFRGNINSIVYTITDDGDCPIPVKFTYNKKGKQETIQLPDNNIVYKDAPLNKSQIKFLQNLIYQGYDTSIIYEDLDVEAYTHNGPRKAYLVKTKTKVKNNKFKYTYIITNYDQELHGPHGKFSRPGGSYKDSCGNCYIAQKDNLASSPPKLKCVCAPHPSGSMRYSSAPYDSNRQYSNCGGVLKQNPPGSYQSSCDDCKYCYNKLTCKSCSAGCNFFGDCQTNYNVNTLSWKEGDAEISNCKGTLKTKC